MAWFAVDDQAHSDPKLIAAGAAARSLWLMAGSWASGHLTDGFVPAHMLSTLGGTRRDADRLAQVGLWEPVQREGQTGWQFHQWAKRNPTRAQVEARRKAWRDRQNRARGKAPQAPVTDISEARTR